MNILPRFAVALTMLSVATLVSAAQERNDLADALIQYVKFEYKKAHASLLPLARGGDSVAQELIAFMYSRGEGIPADGVEALRWFRLAAIGGRTEAQYELGRLYRDGFGVPISRSVAVYWLSQAADQGAVYAMTALGELYCGYFDVAADYVAALAWFTKAAEFGSAQAMFNIGFLYAWGHGVDRSEIEALKWFDLAMRAGPDGPHRMASRVKSELAERLTPIEVQAASMSAKNWLKMRRAIPPVSVR